MIDTPQSITYELGADLLIMEDVRLVVGTSHCADGLLSELHPRWKTPTSGLNSRYVIFSMTFAKSLLFHKYGA